MEDLGVNLSLLEHDFRNFAVLARRSLDQIDHVIDATGLESVLLLLVATIKNTCCQVIRSLSLDNKVKYVIRVELLGLRLALLE